MGFRFSFDIDGLLAYVRSSQPDLSNRQLAVLFIVACRNGPHTVRGLARQLNVSKAVITRTLDKLGELGYLRRRPDETDRRNIFIDATNEGATFLEKFESFFVGGQEYRGTDHRR